MNKNNNRPRQMSANAKRSMPESAPKASNLPKTSKKSAARNPKAQPPVRKNTPVQEKPVQKKPTVKKKPVQKKFPVQNKPVQKKPPVREKPIQKKPPTSPKPPQRPVNRKADKAMAAAMRRRTSQQKRRKFRGGNYILYYLMSAVIVVILLVILSNTVLFKCSQINVSGSTRYSQDEIILSSGLKLGDNLLHISVKDAENSIADALAYIDSAEVKKSFPTRIYITVVEAEKWYCIEQGGITCAVSRGGKIVEQCAAGGLAVVYGMEAESIQPGSWLKSKTDGKTEIPAEVLTAAEKAGLGGITSIDVTDKFSVEVVVDGRIYMELGPAVDVETKLIVAKSIIDSDIGEDDNVTMLLTNPEKVALRNNPVQQTPIQSPEPEESESEEESPESEESEEPEESEESE